jgi:hypothetical protein
LNGGLSWSTPPPFSATVACFYLNAVRAVGASQNHPHRESDAHSTTDVAPTARSSLVIRMPSCLLAAVAVPSPTTSSPFWDLIVFSNRLFLLFAKRKKLQRKKDH